MMAAAQPFISGAISKTINMPHEVTTADIEEAYRLSWELGLKAMALYRDGSKAAQPLNSIADEGDGNENEDVAITAAVEAEKVIHWGHVPAGISPTEAYTQGMKPPRFLLPSAPPRLQSGSKSRWPQGLSEDRRVRRRDARRDLHRPGKGRPPP